ncbi:MAG: GAF domain-containing sensor histidine kinase [Anaerolineae bacterium]|nr:GAF domain-containing sensor histidine kinase [Anaerolineae bacterium]
METKPSRQDWGYFALRWLVLITVLIITYLQPVTTADLGLTLIVAALANVAFLLAAYFPAWRRTLPAVILVGDCITVGLLARISGGDPFLLIASVGAVLLIGGLRLGLPWGPVHAVSVLVSALVGLGGLPDSLTGPFVVIAALGIAGNIWGYTAEYHFRAQRRQIEEIENLKKVEIEDMRERTRGIYEMAATLSSTLSFDKVLDAGLEAGRLALRSSSGKRLTSVVLLFNTEGHLYVATSRGLSRQDEGRDVPGRSGIIGKALQECVPMLGKDARRDPELQYFSGFQNARSLLVIPMRAGYENYGVLLYGSELPDAFTSEHTDFLIAIGTQATVALQNAVLYRNLLDEKERIVDVEEDARKKLARDLHDGPTQSISAIAMRMSYIYRLLERKPDEVPAELKKVEELVRKTTKEIRDMLFTLRPLVLESQGLTAALQQLAEKNRETHNQNVGIYVAADAEKVLDSHQQGVIFYIVEEAVGNARKHAEAELISVRVGRQDDVVVVEIADNGVGFDTGAVDASYDRRGSLGMVNMRERAELLDATLRIDSAEGRGTNITIAVPIKGAREVTQARGPKVAAPSAGGRMSLTPGKPR